MEEKSKRPAGIAFLVLGIVFLARSANA